MIRAPASRPAFEHHPGPISWSPRLDAVVGFDVARSSTPSEYRNFVDNKFLPIEQTTSLRQINITGSVKFALTPRGQRISQFAWIPRTVTPYVGAGGGLVSYDLKQTGDFVDFQDNHVFPSAAILEICGNTC